MFLVCGNLKHLGWQYSYNMTSCNTLRRQQQSRVIGQVVVWLNKSIRVWHRLMFGVGGREENPKLCWGSQIVKLYAALHAYVCVSQRVYVCMQCCCCCRTLQQHFRRKAVNLSNVCTLSPYRQTRQLPLPAPLSTLCRPPGETHSSRADTLDWRFLENALRTQAFSGGVSILWEVQGNCLSFSVKFSKQCAIRAVMRFPQERESARRASSAFSAAFYERRKTRGKGNGWKRHKERVVGGRLLEKLTGKAI